MGKLPRYSIVIPAYNEEERLPRLLSDLSDPLAEFIFVCDGTDGTQGVVEDFTASHPDLMVRCLTSTWRLGKGGGVYMGFRAATAPLVAFMDADNSTTYDQVLGLIDQINGYDGVIGSRYMPGSLIKTHQSFSRRMQSRVFNLLIRALFGLPYSDTQCGAKVFRRESLARVLPDLHATGFEFDVEILWKMCRICLNVIEVPVVWEDAGDSRLQTSDTLSMLKTLLRLRFGLLSGTPEKKEKDCENDGSGGSQNTTDLL
ncbi:MAG TPA: dolichyl-phosphate beta-glucosyltransferase [Methanospirillum sp.]|nr:dolichyl-phosphate beta-glucosyltransferase [Methanospirillum sp.]